MSLNLEKLSKKELTDILNKIITIVIAEDSGLNEKRNLRVHAHWDVNSDLESLIGTIPFLLLNEKIFEKNQDIAEFAKKLDIYIPSPEKKKREDIIGRIVSAIARFDNIRIHELNRAVKSLNQQPRKDKSNFFKDWEEAIMQIKL